MASGNSQLSHRIARYLENIYKKDFLDQMDRVRARSAVSIQYYLTTPTQRKQKWKNNSPQSSFPRVSLGKLQEKMLEVQKHS